jgi:carboxypeptidase family protein
MRRRWHENGIRASLAALSLLVALGGGAAAATLSGFVARSDGKSVKGWTLSVIGAGRVERVVLGDDGAYSVPDLPPGQYFVSSRPPGDEVSDARLAETVEVGTADARRDFHVSRPETALLRGHAVDSADGAVTGARVWLTRRVGSFDRLVAETKTDEAGAFELDRLDPENYELWIQKDDFGTQTQLFAIAAGDEVDTKVVLHRAGVLYGRVEDRSGQLVEGAHVVVRNPEGGVLMDIAVRPDGSGSFEIDGLAPGEYWVSALALGYAPSTSSVELDRTRSVRADFRLGRGGSLRVSARNAADVPIAACAVRIDRLVGDMAYPITSLGTWSADRPRLFVTDASGMAEAGPLEPGRYRVRTLGKKFDEEEAVVQEGKRADVVLQPES